MTVNMAYDKFLIRIDNIVISSSSIHLDFQIIFMFWLLGL
jgi:hypothetical protein